MPRPFPALSLFRSSVASTVQGPLEAGFLEPEPDCRPQPSSRISKVPLTDGSSLLTDGRRYVLAFSFGSCSLPDLEGKVDNKKAAVPDICIVPSHTSDLIP